MEKLESEDYRPTKEESLDSYHSAKIYFEESIRILRNDGINAFRIWHQNNYLQNLKQSKHGTIHFSEYARINNLTNTEFLREYLHARAQGEAAQKEIEKEEQEKRKKQQNSDFIKGELNSDMKD